MNVKLTGRVLRAVPEVVVKLDNVTPGWDATDEEARLPWPADTSRPPVGAHLRIDVEWAGDPW